MRLRIAKLRVVRFLRAAVPLVFLSLVGSLAWNYWMQRQLPAMGRPLGRDLPSNISASTEGLTFQHTEGDRTFYTLKAKTYDKFAEKAEKEKTVAPHLFRGVEVIIYGEKPGDPDRHIESDECAYDSVTGDVEFRGHVTAQLDARTRGRTSVLNYRNHARLALSRTRTTVEQQGGMTAVADRMEFGLDTGVLNLNGSVHAALTGGAELDANSAVFHRKENWVTASADVYMRTPNGWVRGTDGRAELDPDTLRPRTFTLRGGVTAETRSAKTSDLWKLVQADRLDLALSSKGAIERAGAFGQARIEKVAAGSRGQKLAGSEIVSWMDANGGVENVEATGAARLEGGQGDRPTQLSANKIHIDPAGTIVTEGLSRLEAGDSVIAGRNFKIEQGDIVTFTTLFPASVDAVPPARGTAAGTGLRHLQAERSMTARIDGKTNRILSLVSVGAVQFTDGVRRGNADKATVTAAGDNLTLEGAATVVDARTRIDARRIDIAERGSAFSAAGAVKTVSDSASGPITVTSNMARGASGPNVPQTVFYSGEVKTVVRSDAGPLRVTAMEAEGDAAAMTYTGSVETVLQSENGVLRILAAKGAGNADKMVYTGGVQLWRDSVYIASDRLDVWPRDKRFTAEGHVQSRMDTTQGTSARLDYDDARQTVTYSGDARIWKADMTIQGTVVNAVIKDGRVAEAIADGAVTVTQGIRRSTGNHAVYDARMERVTLTGQPVRLNDPEHGNSEGAAATMDLAAKKATITGAADGSPAGRVKSTTKISR